MPGNVIIKECHKIDGQEVSRSQRQSVLLRMRETLPPDVRSQASGGTGIGSKLYEANSTLA